MIVSLQENEVFVFGSNQAGKHLGGAAKQAFDQFGAEWGIGEGMTGKCYAFPTLADDLSQLPASTLQEARDRLFSAAVKNPHLRFLLTKVGCGIASYPEPQMQALFAEHPQNIILPEEWQKVTKAFSPQIMNNHQCTSNCRRLGCPDTPDHG